MMDRDDIIDLLAIISTVDNRQVTDADIIVWHEHLERFDKDECLTAIMQHQKEYPSAWMQPGHVVQRVRAAHRDTYERTDPDKRGGVYGTTGVREDRYGVVDKSAPDDPEYPAEWTSDERIHASWERVYMARQSNALNSFSPDLSAPASDMVRHEAMAHIRSMLHR